MNFKKIIFSVLGLLILLAAGTYIYDRIVEYQEEKKHKAWVAGLSSTASENVHILTDTMMIDYLGEKRSLGIYLPKGYKNNDSTQYPVVYFLDGQSLFDMKIKEGLEWQIDEILDSLGTLGQEQAIVVGVYNSDDRLTEYKPWTSPHLPKEKVVSGDKHAEWVATDLKKWVDDNFRTLKGPEHTVIGGASLAGLMSYYMTMTYPEVYGRAIVYSPSFWVNDKVYELHKGVDLNNKRIYFDAGELETPTVESIEKMEGILLAAGMPRENMRLDVEKGEGHWHATWIKGSRKVFPWIIGE